MFTKTRSVCCVSLFLKYMIITKPWHREEEPHNSHDTPGRQAKQSHQLCDC